VSHRERALGNVGMGVPRPVLSEHGNPTMNDEDMSSRLGAGLSKELGRGSEIRLGPAEKMTLSIVTVLVLVL
jgi:hypothetical protein